MDWSAAGAVTRVKNQGQCNACYAFASTGAIEGFQFLKTGVLQVLSEQQIIDCSKDSFGNYGCIGGKVSNALDFVKSSGLVT